MKRVSAPETGATAEFSDPEFSAAVIRWQKQHGRHALPWQNTTDAYRIWLSEIMLQQTQVVAVIPYYQRFLQRFPDVRTLAVAPVDDVMAHWSGLGYYSRARNLHRCARQVVTEHGGVFPSDPALLAELPGIGRSTAAAIAAFSYGARAAILDGNVKRVFARVFGVEAYPGEKKTEEALWRRADALLPSGKKAGDMTAYTQGLMDLGATLCSRSRPSCGTCPLMARCVAFNTGRTAELPVRKPKKAVPEKHAVMLVVIDKGQVLLQQRPETGIWGGLLSLPEVGGFTAQPMEVEASSIARTVKDFGVVSESEPLPAVVHGFTHFRLTINPYVVRLRNRLPLAAQSGHAWLSKEELPAAHLPAPIKKLLLNL